MVIFHSYVSLPDGTSKALYLQKNIQRKIKKGRWDQHKIHATEKKTHIASGYD